MQNNAFFKKENTFKFHNESMNFIYFVFIFGLKKSNKFINFYNLSIQKFK